jgi:oligopeptide transport system substrate-binding protein
LHNKPHDLALAGKLDVTRVPSVYLKQWKGRSSQYHQYPSSAVYYLFPNVHMAPFDNVHCRLALAYAIDRETIANNILGGAMRATYAVVPKGMLGYYSGKDNPHYDQAKARAELAQCPGRTTPFELTYATGGLYKNEFPAIGSMLSTVGMNVRLKPLKIDDWLTIVNQSLQKTNTQLLWEGWVQDYPDPQDYCSLLLRSGAQYNVGGWHNATYDRLVDKADVTLNRKQRAQLYVRAQHIALSQGALILLNNLIIPELIKPYVYGVIGTEAFPWLQPEGGDWANVSVSKH